MNLGSLLAMKLFGRFIGNIGLMMNASFSGTIFLTYFGITTHLWMLILGKKACVT